MKLTLVSFVRFLILAVILGLVFFLGNLYAVREAYNSIPSKVQSKTNNGFVENSLSQIEFRDVFGLLDGNRGIYGDILIKEIDGRTEILIKIDNVPAKIRFENVDYATPEQLTLRPVRVCCNGLDYEGVTIDTTDQLVMNLETKDGIRKGQFTTTLNYSFDRSLVDRILFESARPNLFKITKDDIKDWTKNSTDRPAPYFWANLR